ncbi:MAG: choice-of-anchor B family protein [Bacteroidia bacterium]|nr:choice-of-anchor B family protein [Bacteroidia bacterium]
MKHLLLFMSLWLMQTLSAQTYDSQNIQLLAHLDPNNNLAGIGVDARKYSGCWGWYQASKNKEYAIIGASHGTYFIDVSNPTSPTVSAFVPGKTNCTWREMKTYQNYCYIVSDDFSPNRFQIVDMSTLPDSVSIVHDGTTYFERGHTIWIDQNKMYIGGHTDNSGLSPMAIYSLATPTAPVLLKKLEEDIPNSIINYVHDMYVRNDTVYASSAFQGLYVLKYNSVLDSLTILGSYVNYATQGYNHSSFLTQNGKHLVFCDEVPEAMPIRLVNVENFSNIQPVKTFKPADGTTPHNPYVIGNDFAVVSCYQDGLYIYNISTPSVVSLSGFFDTYPQGGFQQNDYTGTYRGNWGAYPYLPSGIIIANDMQNGVFILDATAAYTTTVVNPVNLEEINLQEVQIKLFPNPVDDEVKINYPYNIPLNYKIYSTTGTLVASGTIEKSGTRIKTSHLAVGMYVFQVESKSSRHTQKLIISH